MHELGIVFHIQDQVEEIAEENGKLDVAAVILQIGEVSTIETDYLHSCWNWAKAKTRYLKEAELQVEVVDAITWCDACHHHYPTIPFGKICPCCGSDQTWLVQGNETIIKEIMVFDEE